MTPETVVQIIRQALMTTFWLAAPLLAIGFIAGIVISLVQIATSMQDNAFSTIPRLLAFSWACCFLLPWMLQRIMATRSRCSETWAAMPANLTLSDRHAVRLSAGAGAGRRRAGLRAAAGLQGRSRAGARRPGAGLHAGALQPVARRSRPTPSPWRCSPAGPLAEAAVGIAIGVSVAIVLEAFTLAAQVLGLQAGYAYASTIDPNYRGRFRHPAGVRATDGGMLFFALGLDREVLRLFAQSLDKVPAGAYVFSRGYRASR